MPLLKKALQHSILHRVYQMAFQRGAYPGRYACNNRTTLAYSWLDSRQNFNFASFPPRYSRTSTYDNCAHDSVYVRKPVLMDYNLKPYSPIQANVSYAYLGFMCSWIFIFQKRWGIPGDVCNQQKDHIYTCVLSIRVATYVADHESLLSFHVKKLKN